MRRGAIFIFMLLGAVGYTYYLTTSHHIKTKQSSSALKLPSATSTLPTTINQTKPQEHSVVATTKQRQNQTKYIEEQEALEQSLKEKVIERLTYNGVSYYQAFKHTGISIIQLDEFHQTLSFDSRSTLVEDKLRVHVNKYAVLGVIDDYNVYCNSYGCEVMVNYNMDAEPTYLAEFESVRLHSITGEPLTVVMTIVEPTSKFMYTFAPFDKPLMYTDNRTFEDLVNSVPYDEEIE